MRTNTLQQAFPIVAAALGNRFGIKVRVGGDQAYTDGKTIQLPAYDGTDPDYQDYAWGLLAHEAAHIRYSDFSLSFGGSVLLKRLSGAIEDVRIEYELGKDYPGTRLTLKTVVEKMITKGGFISSQKGDHPANVLYGYVLKSLRARVLGQTSLSPLVLQSEAVLNTTFPKGAVIRLKGLLSEVPNQLASERDCLDLAKRILMMIEQEVEQTKRQQQEQRDQNQQDHEQNQQQSDQDDQNPQSPSDDADNTVEELSDEKTDSCDAQQPDLTSEPEADLEPDAEPDQQAGQQAEPESQSDAANPDDNPALPDLEQMLETLLSAEDADLDQDMFETIKSTLALEPGTVSEQLMPLGLEPILRDHQGLKRLNQVQSESLKIRVALQGLVQSQTLSRVKLSNRGKRIEGNRLHRLSLGDPKVFQRRAIKTAPNTAIHLLVDKSESMDYSITDGEGHPLGTRMTMALEASMALALALEGLPGVNPGVSAFPGNSDSSVYRLLAQGQRVKQRAGAFTVSPSGSTPMTEAIWFAASELLSCQETRKVLMVMTDGQPNDTISTLEILQRCRDSGIETVGIGLGIEVSHLFPVSIVINDFRELRSQLFELSKTVLLAA